MQIRKYLVSTVVLFLLMSTMGYSTLKHKQTNNDISALLINQSGINNFSLMVSRQTTTAIVMTTAEFNAALDDPGISKIQLGANIVGNQFKGPYLRNIEFDGMGLYSLDMGLFYVSFGNNIHVNVKNMNLSSTNSFGPFIVLDGYFNSTITYENINYTGWQLGYNLYGAVEFKGTNVLVINSLTDEAIEASFITFKENSVNTITVNDDAFWLKGSLTPTLTVENNVKLTTTANYITYGLGIIIDIQDNSDVHFISRYKNNIFAEVTSLVVGVDSTFLLEGTGVFAVGPLFEINGDITLEAGATFDLKATNVAYDILLGLTKLNSKINIADTATLKLYNKNSPLIRSFGDINLGGNEIKGWVNADVGGNPTIEYGDIIGKITRSFLTTTLPNTTDTSTFNANFKTENYSKIHFLPGLKSTITAGSTSETLEATNAALPNLTTLFNVVATDYNLIDITNDTTYSGEPLNLATPGVYTILASVIDDQSKTAGPITLTLTIIDTTIPILTIANQNLNLEASNDQLPNFNTLFGATATDTLDGNITNNITYINLPVDMKTSGVYNITANVLDSSLNQAAPINFTLTIADTTKPIITQTNLSLNIEAQNIALPDLTTLFGLNAQDIIDGDITDQIQYTNQPTQINVPGTYVIKANVSDTSLNSAVEVELTLIIEDTVKPIITSTNLELTINATPGLLADITTLFGVNGVDSLDGNISANTVYSDAPLTTDVVGVYLIKANLQDNALNSANEVTLILNIVDGEIPVISTPILTLTQEASNSSLPNFLELFNISAIDNIDGDITNSIVITGAPTNMNIPGEYTIYLNVEDSSNNIALEKMVTLIIKDTTAPQIFVNFTILTIEATNSGLADLKTLFGINANDSVDGNILNSLEISGAPLNAKIPGTYVITLNIKDANLNQASELMVTLIIEDTTKPVISALLTQQIMEATNNTDIDITTYFLISANDTLDGVITLDIQYTGVPINLNIPGTYVIKANVKDLALNRANEVLLTLIIQDTTPPILTFTTTNVVLEAVNVPLPNFTDLFGGDAYDIVNNNLTGDIVYRQTPTSMNIPGIYLIKANVKDSLLNSAVEQILTLEIRDITKPILSVVQNNVIIEASNDIIPNIESLFGFSASDAVDGILTSSIQYIGIPLAMNIPGTYIISASVSDSSSNISQTFVSLTIIDTIKPIINATRQQVIEAVPNYSTDYLTLFNVTATDFVDGDISLNVELSNKPTNTNIPGTYLINANVQDAAGNIANTVILTLIIQDTTAPVINATLSSLQIEASTNPVPLMSDLFGISGTDSVDGEISENIFYLGMPTNMNIVSTYEIIVTLRDSSSNVSTRTFILTVGDTIIPMISANNTELTIEANTNTVPDITTLFGVQASDAVDGNLTSRITYSNLPTNMNIVQSYNIIANVKDVHNNQAIAKTLILHVVDTTRPIITLLSDLQTIEANTNGVPNPETLFGVSANDTVDGNLTSNIVYRGMPINMNIPGLYTVKMNVLDNSLNEANEQSATLEIKDTTKPILTIDNTYINIEASSNPVPNIQTLFGISATDSVDGNLDNMVTFIGIPLTLEVVGNYSITVNISDAHNNKTTETIILGIGDTTNPEIHAVDSIITIEAINEPLRSIQSLFGVIGVDSIDGVITQNIMYIGAPINQNEIGTHLITGTLKDSHNNSTQITLTLIIIDTTAPIITAGIMNKTIEATNGSLPDFQALFNVSALDTIDGDLTVNIIYTGMPSSMLAVGVYAIQMNVKDNSMNQAITKTVILTIEDTTKPIISTSMNMLTVEGNLDGVFDPTNFNVSATDIVDGNISANIEYLGMPTNMLPGVYTIFANIKDSSNNHAIQLTLTLFIVDTTKPKIMSKDTELSFIFPIVNKDYLTLFGISALDTIDGDITNQIIIDDSLVDYSRAGTYTLNISVKDNANNEISTTLLLTIIDSIAPTITSVTTTSTIEATNLNVDIIRLFAINAIDNISGNLTSNLSISIVKKEQSAQSRIGLPLQAQPLKTINFNIPGTYEVTVSAVDSSFNQSTLVLTLIIVDTTAPILNFQTNNITLKAGLSIQDAINLLQVTVNDIADLNLNIDFDFSKVDFNKDGTYSGSASATDSSNNKVVEQFKVNIVDAPVHAKELVNTGFSFNIYLYLQLLMLFGAALVVTKKVLKNK